MVYLQRASGQFKLYERHAAKKLYSVDCELLFRQKTSKNPKYRSAQTARPGQRKPLRNLSRRESVLVQKLKAQLTTSKSRRLGDVLSVSIKEPEDNKSETASYLLSSVASARYNASF